MLDFGTFCSNERWILLIVRSPVFDILDSYAFVRLKFKLTLAPDSEIGLL